MEFEIIWDDDEMKQLDAMASILLSASYSEWLSFKEKLANPHCLADEGNDYFEIAESTIEEYEGDLTEETLSLIFLDILEYEDLIVTIDWKEEMESGQLASFAAERYHALLDIDDAAELKERLIKLTNERELAKVCDINKVHLDIIFERIQAQLDQYNLILAHLFDGSDCYHIFVTTKADFIKLQNIDSEYLTAMTCSH